MTFGAEQVGEDSVDVPLVTIKRSSETSSYLLMISSGCPLVAAQQFYATLNSTTAGWRGEGTELLPSARNLLSAMEIYTRPSSGHIIFILLHLSHNNNNNSAATRSDCGGPRVSAEDTKVVEGILIANCQVINVTPSFPFFGGSSSFLLLLRLPS